MKLQNPVAIYSAASNNRADAICLALRHSGIPATVIEDVAGVGLWMAGTLPGIHTPKVWVEEADVERATAIIEEFLSRDAELHQEAGTGQDIEVTCEACGRVTRFTAAQRGSVQECPDCGGYMDVGEDDEDWGEAEEETPE